ncbi:GyrI-like domain-containing protein [Pseudonocardia parietis]|uniref:GyrI-like small molecule binding domain-containing protein n=1 Tax=Pseudonocardia parietis TaxID=570936 RepID=A0ABS4VU03_9PSEU|nr:GyrI-like domain-containing protein [Pseudonocardia parietis]MBP2367271.1 hypothetical protein [Pseudonocardia parietis]
MSNYDVKKAFPRLYSSKVGEFEIVDVPPLSYFQVDGHGDPNTTESYANAVRTLYTASYAARAIAKSELGRVHTVAPLEGLWSADDPTVFASRDKAGWDWTMMITQPEWISAEIAHAAVEAARAKAAPAVDLLRFEEYREGVSVQTLHVGPYDDEGPVLARLHDEYMPGNGWTWNGRHHEIYLSDPRRAAPDKLRTVLRQPVKLVRTGVGDPA